MKAKDVALFVSVGALSIGLIALGIVYANQPSTDVCLTTECVTASSRIINSMDLSVDPCNNFWKFACGSWNEDHIISDDQSSVSTFNDLRDDVSKTLKKVLEGETSALLENKDSVKKAKDFYASCMNTAKIDELGTAPVLDLIKEMGGWPILGDAFDSNGFVLEDVLGKFRAVYGTYSVITSYVGADSKSSLDYILHLDQPSLGLPSRDYYLDQATREKTVPSYKEYIVNLVSALASDPDAIATTATEFADLVVAFETDLATISAPDSERRNEQDIYKNYLISELSDKISSSFDWLRYINKVLEVGTPTPVTVTADEKIVVYGTDYLVKFFEMLPTKPEYTYEFMQNYFVWRILKGRTSYMSKTLRDTAAPYNRDVRGVTAEQQRWMTCSDTANSFFSMPVGALFVDAAFPEENKAVTEELVANLKVSMQEIINEAQWMDDDTKIRATEKLNKIEAVIAYPDYILDPNDQKMDNDYKNVQISTDGYFENVQGLTLLGEADGFGRLKTEVDRQEWFTGPAVVNAFYSPSRNSITFPAGILQPPFYDPGQPTSMNYGGIGMVIGHEITHGFDDSGAEFNGDGNLEDWWSPSSRANFEDAAWCMKQQYSRQYWEIAGLNVNGNLTIGENIADNGGIREAYMAYQTWKKSNKDIKMPGKPFDDWSDEQLFFLGQAQVWCGTYTEARAIQLQKTDPHSPGEFRVNVPAQNLKEFGEAYGCKKGVDTMYPPEEETCRVW